MRLPHWLGRVLASPPVARRQTVVRFRPQVEALECRRVLSTLLVSPTGLLGTTPTVYTSIQSAVDASAPGDTVLVGPGTYQEQVLITKSGLTLTSSTPRAAIILSPQNDALAGNAALVDIQGAANVVLDGFTIAGPGPTSIGVGSIKFGVYVDNSSSTTIENNRVTQIGDAPLLTSIYSGVGIQVGLSPDSAGALGLASTVGSAVIVNNTVADYQEAGIVVDNAGSGASIQGNVVTGLPNEFVAQNGIQVSDGATGVVQNNVVSSNLYCPDAEDEGEDAVGILLSNPGPGVQVLNNTVQFNDQGIVVQGALNPIISGNTVSLSTYHGILLNLGTTGAQVTFNVSHDNGLSGIYVNADHNTIANNTTTSNSRDGIQLVQASGNLVQGNTASGNARYGISAFLSAGQSDTFQDNNVYGNQIRDMFP